MIIRFCTLRLVASVVCILLSATIYAQTRFDPLFRLANVKGVCLVRTPGTSAFVPVINRKAYPYGTTVQIGQASEAVVLFSSDNSILLTGPAEATVAIQTENAENRVLRLASGEARTFTDESLSETAIIVETPVATCDAFAGQATIKTSRDADANIVLQVDATGGGTRITGSQFTIAKLKSACGIQIRSTPDRSLTHLVNTGGDYTIVLDNGTETPVPFESTSKSSVKIRREFAPVGGRLIVSVFAIGPDGKGKESYAFAVGQPSATSSGMPAIITDVATNTSSTSTPVSTVPAVPKKETPVANSIF